MPQSPGCCSISTGTIRPIPPPTGLPNGGSAPGSSSSTGPPNTNASLAPGTCLTSSPAVVPCGATHVYEVARLAGSGCTVSAVLPYLGGDPNLDLTIATTRSIQIPGRPGSACVVTNPGGVGLSGSASDVLLGDEGSAWRRCLDSRGQPKTVSCAALHSGEYVGVPPGTVPNLQQCEAAAANYLSTPIDRVSRDLKVSSLQSGDPGDEQPRCLISVRTTDLLQTSVRNLGSSTVPLISPP